MRRDVDVVSGVWRRRSARDDERCEVLRELSLCERNVIVWPNLGDDRLMRWNAVVSIERRLTQVKEQGLAQSGYPNEVIKPRGWIGIDLGP